MCISSVRLEKIACANIYIMLGFGLLPILTGFRCTCGQTPLLYLSFLVTRCDSFFGTKSCNKKIWPIFPFILMYVVIANPYVWLAILICSKWLRYGWKRWLNMTGQPISPRWVDTLTPPTHCSLCCIAHKLSRSTRLF